MRSQNHTDVTMYIFKVCADFHRGVEGLNIQTTVLTRSSSIVYTLKIYKNLRFTWGGQWCITASIPTNIEFHMYVFVSRCLRLYKVQNVLVYIPPTITYIYGLKKHLFMLISSTTTKSVNVAWNGMDVTVKYLSFCQDFRTPNRFLAAIIGSNSAYCTVDPHRTHRVVKPLSSLTLASFTARIRD